MMEKLLDLAKQKDIELEVFVTRDKSTRLVIFNDELEKQEISNVTEYLIKACIDGKFTKLKTDSIDDPEKILEILTSDAQIIESNDADFFAEESSIDFHEEEKPINYNDVILQLKGLMELKIKYPSLLSMQIYLTENFSEFQIKNTRGICLKDSNNYYHYNYEISVIDDDKVMACYGSFVDKNYDFEKLQSCIIKKIDEAVYKLNSESCKTQKYNIILKNNCVYDILKAFLDTFKAEKISQKLSILNDKLHSKVCSEKISLIEDPNNVNLCGKRLFDNEGTKTQYKEIIKNGVFEKKLYDNKSALKDNVKSTGNSYGVRNLYIKPGECSYDEMFRSLDNGIVIDNVEGMHSGINVIDGTISLQAQGYMVKNGKADKPLNMIVLSANFFEIFNQVKEVGNDLEFFGITGGCPSLLIENITIAGNVK